MQEEAAVLTYRLAIAFFGVTGVYFLMLWLMSKYIPDFSQEDVYKEPPVFPKRDDFLKQTNDIKGDGQ